MGRDCNNFFSSNESFVLLQQRLNILYIGTMNDLIEMASNIFRFMKMNDNAHHTLKKVKSLLLTTNFVVPLNAYRRNEENN